MKKLVKDGKVAVLYSPGFGAGWYTWNYDWPDMMFDPDIVQLVEEGAPVSQIISVAARKWPDAYLGGADDLAVKWLDEGTLFRIHEYDGSESIEIREEMNWYVA